MIFTAYFDESDSHGGCNGLTMGAVLGTGRQWEIFGRRLKRLQAEFNFGVFHATKVKSGVKHNKVRLARMQTIVERLATLLKEDLTQTVALTLPRELYLSEYRNKPFPRRMRIDSQWGIAFRFCLVNVIHVVRETKGKHRLHVVVEDGHENVGSAVVIAKQIRADPLAQDILGDVTFANKETCPPLMAADLVAHTFKISADRQRVGKPGVPEMMTHTPGRTRGGQSIINVRASDLHALKGLFERQQQEKHAAYIARKTAYLSGLSEKKP